jgi:hypothetical protein
MINAAVFDNDPAMDEQARTRYSRSYSIRPQFCPRCGHDLLAVGEYCSQCGLPIPDDERFYEDPDASPCSRLVALVLCALLGYLGIHRFYVGKIASGILWLCTGGLFGVGYIIDLILIATGNFRDIDGDRLVFWD